MESFKIIFATLAATAVLAGCVLDLADDAANADWGGAWRMPIKEEFDALCNLTKQWETGYNYNSTSVNGYLFTENSNSIFLPAAGYGDGTGLNGVGDDGYYWSSSLYTGTPYFAYELYFNVGDAGTSYNGRCCGQSIRPVAG